MFLGTFEIVPQIVLPKCKQISDIIRINTCTKIICMPFRANLQSEISSICTNSENMQEINQNVTLGSAP